MICASHDPAPTVKTGARLLRVRRRARYRHRAGIETGEKRPLNASSSAANGAHKPRVVIVGGGFAGLSATRALKSAPVEITLIDRRNHHLFQPLLYQVATATLSETDVARPIRSLLKDQKNVEVLMAEVTGIDLDAKQVETADGPIGYDYLVLATGASHSYFGNDQWEPFAPGLKTIEDAMGIRSRVLQAFEDAERTDDQAKRDALMTFIVVGAGPTGVEVAGGLSEIAHHTLVDEFKRIDPRQARVILVEALDRVLPPFPPELSAMATKALHELGVEIMLGKPVTHIEPGLVRVGDKDIPCETVLWAAGVKASPLGKQLGVDTDRAGRVPVEADLSLAGHPEVFVVGDLSAAKSKGKPVPGVAPAAMQAGAHVGRVIEREARGMSRRPFVYNDRGTMAIIGRNKAVASVNGKMFDGVAAWLMWLSVHLGYLSGIQNRVNALVSWVNEYTTRDHNARLITRPVEKASS